MNSPIEFLFRLNENRLRRLAGILLLVWYPFTHLYHYHSVIGTVPRFLDGVFGAVSVGVTVVFLAFLTFQFSVRRGLSSRSAVVLGMFFLFLFAAGSIVVSYRVVGSGPRGSEMVFSYYARMLLSYAFLFSLGFYADVTRNRLFWLLSFFLICINTVMFINWNRLMIDLRFVVDPRHAGAYLGLSGTAMISGYIAWAVARTRLVRVLVLLLLGVLLFFLASRANLAVYILVLPFVAWFTFRRRSSAVSFLVTGLLVIGSIAGVIGGSVLTASRHAQFFSLDQMTSLISRNQYLATGLKGIGRNLIVGDYAGQVVTHGSHGSYIHNWLSVWQAFGLLPFVLYSTLLVFGVYLALKWLVRFRYHAPRNIQLLSILLLVVFIQVLAAKSVGWSDIALAWGMLAARLAETPVEIEVAAQTQEVTGRL